MAEGERSAKPVLLAVDDEPSVARAVQRDLRRKYGSEFRVLRAESGAQALELLGELRRRAEPVAMIISDQRMPGMTGTETLARVKELLPSAKRVLLTAYADTQAAIDAINVVRLDHYLMKPWDPPEEELYPLVDDLLDDWSVAAVVDEGVRVIGHRYSRDSHAMRDFLARSYIPFRWIDVDGADGDAGRLLEATGLATPQLPVVFLPDGAVLQQPSVRDVAEAVGISTAPDVPFYDIVVVGAGPAGLAAAVYGASEGLRTALVERDAPGGQAGQSSRIENYLGFPVGLSGGDLTRRATSQAQRFGAELVNVREVEGIEERGSARVVRLAGGDEIQAHAVVIATGVTYRLLDAAGVEQLTGRGVYYGGSRAEAASVRDEPVVVVGGANSAGQAALYFAEFAERVSILCRGDDLANSMSSYLVERIEESPTIEVRTQTEVAEAHGEDGLEGVTLARSSDGEREWIPAKAMFVFIGARPNTDWLDGVVARDERGFILAGPDALASEASPAWPLSRAPLLLETTMPGVFVAGDVRHDSIKRVAAAVGDGSTSIQLVHQYMGTLE